MTYRTTLLAPSSTLRGSMRVIGSTWTDWHTFRTLAEIRRWLGANIHNVRAMLDHNEPYFVLVAFDEDGVAVRAFEASRDWGAPITEHDRTTLRDMLRAVNAQTEERRAE